MAKLTSVSKTTYKNCFFNKLPLTSDTAEENHIVIESKWHDNEIEFNIIEYRGGQTTSITWQGILRKETLEKTAEALEIDYDDFFKETKQAITTQNGLENFQYSIDDGTFIWKKVDGLAGKIRYGLVELDSIPDLKDAIVVNALDIISDLRSGMESVVTESKKLRELHETFVENYEKTVNDSIQHNNKLMAQFLDLLNSKKEEIVKLKKLNNNLTSTAASSSKNIVQKNQRLSESLFSDSETSMEEGSPVIAAKPQLIENAVNDSVFTQSQDLSPVPLSTVPKRMKMMEPKPNSGSKSVSEVMNILHGIKVNVPSSSAARGSSPDKFEIDTQQMLDEI